MKKLFSSGFFGLAILCFCLPWVTVSCQQQKISTFTGIQMVTGTEVVEPGSGMFGGPAKKKQVEPNALAVVAVVAAVAAFFISLIAGGASAVPAVIGILVAFTLKSNIDQDIVKQGQGLLNVTYESGFWAYVLLLTCGSLSNLIPRGATSEISQNASQPADNLKKCPMCAEPINFEALVCKHCGNKFDESDVKIAIEQKTKLQTAHYCPRCEMTYPIEETVCDVCRMELIKTDSRENNQGLPEEKICPMCAETVKAAARICKHCRHDFELIKEKPLEVISPPIIADKDTVKQPSSLPIDTHLVEVPSSINDYEVQPPSAPPPSKNNTFRYIAGSVFLIVIIVSFGYLYKIKALPDKITGNKGGNVTTQASTSTGSSKIKNSISPNKYCGIWEYDQYGSKSYFKITDVGKGKYRFSPGYKYEGKYVWNDPILTNAKGIYLKYGNGKLKGKFISANFYATHGQYFTYRITLNLRSDDKVTYSVHSTIRDETDISEATKISG
uniref:DZANK-type domain-containing protein n=1 Tax=Geobacter sp. (strain M21) TaxID=443144 RepID=C6DZB4_GEOSM